MQDDKLGFTVVGGAKVGRKAFDQLSLVVGTPRDSSLVFRFANRTKHDSPISAWFLCSLINRIRFYRSAEYLFQLPPNTRGRQRFKTGWLEAALRKRAICLVTAYTFEARLQVNLILANGSTEIRISRAVERYRRNRKGGSDVTQAGVETYGRRCPGNNRSFFGNRKLWQDHLVLLFCGDSGGSPAFVFRSPGQHH